LRLRGAYGTPLETGVLNIFLQVAGFVSFKKIYCMKNFTPLFFVLLLFISFNTMAQDTTNKEMTGKYKFPAGSVIPEAVVTWDNGVLTMNSVQGVSALERIKGDTFNVVSFSGTVVFKRNEARKITGVHVDASGYIFDGVKDDTNITNDEVNESTVNVTRDKIAGRNVTRFRIPGCIIE
jgi:hypothetical protein